MNIVLFLDWNREFSVGFPLNKEIVGWRANKIDRLILKHEEYKSKLL